MTDRPNYGCGAGLYGLFLGLAFPAAADANSSEAAGVGLLLGGPAGFLLASAYAGHRDLSIGQARAITWGGTWGTWQGWGWTEVTDWGGTEQCFGGNVCYSDASDSRRFLGAILGGAIGIGTGVALSHRNITPGVATSINFGSLWGSWFGFAAGYLADQEDDALLATTLLGGNAGLLATALLAPDWEMTRSRARLISIAGVLGGLAGVGVDLLADLEGNTAVAVPLATSVTGLIAGAYATRPSGLASTADPGASPDEFASDLGTPFGALIQRHSGGWTTALPLPRAAAFQNRVGTSTRVARFELLRLAF